MIRTVSAYSDGNANFVAIQSSENALMKPPDPQIFSSVNPAPGDTAGSSSSAKRTVGQANRGIQSQRVPPLSLFLPALALAWIVATATLHGADSPQWGGSPSRNHVSLEKNIPTEWKVGEFDEKTGRWLRDSAKNVRWAARLGSQTYGTPVVSGGKVFCATNNAAGWVPRFGPNVDLGCLLCFQEDDGKFGWQLSREKLAAGRALDWPQVGICCSPLVEGKRCWLVTNRCEVLCLDIEGFYDRKNDGPYRSEPNSDRKEADILWCFDMIGQLGVVPHNMSSCSVTATEELLLVNTGNGVDESHQKVVTPDAPSFIALDKKTGKLVWADSSPGQNIVHGQWSSPAYGTIRGVPQAIFAGGDGWVYSFAGKPVGGNKPELLWKFDCNPKTAVWKEGGQGDRATIIATPVICNDCVYIATGEDPEYGEGPGHLWCIDATRRGDTSPELVFDKAGKPVPPRRLQAADPSAGDVVRPNPNSAAVWHYSGSGAKGGDAKADAAKADGDFKQTMHRTLGMAAIQNDLLVIGDLAGLLHCLDAKTGRVHWTYDMLSAMWGSPVLVDGKIYMGNEDGDVAVFELSPKLKLLAKNNMGAAVYTTPIVANGTLFVATRTHLIAVGSEK